MWGEACSKTPGFGALAHVSLPTMGTSHLERPPLHPQASLLPAPQNARVVGENSLTAGGPCSDRGLSGWLHPWPIQSPLLLESGRGRLRQGVWPGGLWGSGIGSARGCCPGFCGGCGCGGDRSVGEAPLVGSADPWLVVTGIGKGPPASTLCQAVTMGPHSRSVPTG